jgi:NAD dependent epimerase/dehydratase family enzyme
MADWLDAARFLLDRDDIVGPVNLVGPAPVTNAEFTRELARQLHRPAVIPIPALALKVVLGGFAHEALTSTRVLPGVLTGAGFTYRHPDLAAALRAALTDQAG